MNMGEYEGKLRMAVDRAVTLRISQMRSVVVNNFEMEIDDIIGIFSNCDIHSIKLPQLLSGKEFSVNVEGNVRVMAKDEDGATSKGIEFWVRPAIVRFDHDSDDFVVIDVSQFVALQVKSF